MIDFSAKTIESTGVSNASSTLLIRQTSMDVQGPHDELESRPHSIQASSLRATSSPNEDDINVHRRLVFIENYHFEDMDLEVLLLCLRS